MTHYSEGSHHLQVKSSIYLSIRYKFWFSGIHNDVGMFLMVATVMVLIMQSSRNQLVIPYQLYSKFTYFLNTFLVHSLYLISNK